MKGIAAAIISIQYGNYYKPLFLTPLCVSGLGRAFARFHAPIRVAALKSITLLTYPRFTASSGLLTRYLLMYSYSLSFRFH